MSTTLAQIAFPLDPVEVDLLCPTCDGIAMHHEVEIVADGTTYRAFECQEH